jgi:hypothetical protein
MPKKIILLPFPFLLFSQTKDSGGLFTDTLNILLQLANFYKIVKMLLVMSIYYSIKNLSPTFNIKNHDAD